ncbi:MAG: serine/threonine-protein kinase [Myxococcota bacterium]
MPGISQEQTQEGTPRAAPSADAVQANIDTAHDTRGDQVLAPLGAGGIVQRGIRDVVRERLFNKAPAEQRIGRYIVLQRIGRGGMGMVFAAYDEELDRKVAIKLLDAHGRVGDVSKLRLKREAQAMARLSHPNVATVHEVGEADDEVYVAMEFIRGESLDMWIRTKPPWREVQEVFIQAGRGLAAAHAAGIVHRDLKPHNIMRGEDGTVKVLDFGLARTDGEEHWEPDSQPGSQPDSQPSSGSGSALAVDLTRTGAVLGTPAYMAPEQHMGEVADARSDQFSFCVTLYEALYGQHPFDCTTLASLVNSVRNNDLRPPPAGSAVPSWVFRIVSRGLSHDPEQRWSSVQDLIDALAQDPARTQRRWLAAAGLVVIAGLLGFGLSEFRGLWGQMCPGASVHQEGLWPAAQRERVIQAFQATGSPLATDTAARVTALVDIYVRAWARMRTEACEAHRQGRQSDRFFDLRTACLDERRAGLDELLTAFEAAHRSTVENATWAAASLPSLSVCADLQALTAAVPPPEDRLTSTEVRAQREVLASVASQSLMGAYDDAADQARRVLDDANLLGYEPLMAEAQLRLGAVLLEAHQHQPAHDMLSAAVDSGLRSGHDEVVVEALARRMWVAADPLRRPTEGLWDGSIATSLNEKIGRPTRLSWLLLNNRGAALFRGGLHQDAERSYRDALAVIEAQGSSQYPVELISTRTNLAILLSSGLGRPGEAAREFRAVRTQTIEFLGRGHPRASGYWYLVAESLIAVGRYREALDELNEGMSTLEPSARYLRGLYLVELSHLHSILRRDTQAFELASSAMELGSEAFPDDHLMSAARWFRGIAQIGLGQTAAGVADLHRAVELGLERSGPDHEFVATARWWAGHGLVRAGQLDEAIEQLERAHAIFAGLGPSASAYLGRQSFRLVDAYLERGELASAEALIAETIRAQERAGFPSDGEHRSLLLMSRADLWAARGEQVRALVDYERACEYFERAHDADDPVLARCRFAWARAVGPGPQANRLARSALATYESLGEGFALERAEVEVFLADTPSGVEPLAARGHPPARP